MAHFTQKVTATRHQHIMLVTGGCDTTGRAAWYYLQLEPRKAPLFHSAIASGHATLDHFGTIIESGYGSAPPAVVNERMKQLYHFEAAA